MSRILRLVAENVKRLKVVDVALDPKKPLVLIRGKNGTGKSSLIDTIAFILGGKRVQPPEVINRGESYARGLLETEELEVERKWTVSEKTGEVKDWIEVRSREGAKFKSPQTMLDGLISRLSFDPLHFLSLDPPDQAETLRRIVGLDFAKLDGKRLKAFDDRTEVNRELLAHSKRLEAHPPGVAGPERDVAALLADREVASGKASEAKRAEDRAVGAKVAAEQAAAAVREAEEAMRKAYNRLKVARAAEELANTARAEAIAALPPAALLSELAGKINSASQHNEQVRQGLARAELATKVGELETRAAALTAEIAAIDAEKEKLTTAAAFPVKGLGFSDVGVMFNGFPFEQASGAERIRVSTGIGFALNPKLKVLRIKDGSLLDNESLALLEELAAAADGQIFLEMISKDAVGVVIEDGIVMDNGEVYSLDGVKVAQ